MKITIAPKDEYNAHNERFSRGKQRSLSQTGTQQTSWMLTGYVEELAKVLAEEKRLEEKIHETQGHLSLVKKKISETLVQGYLGDGNVAVQEDLMKAEQTYERLLQALLDMKKNFEHQMHCLDEHIVQAKVDELRHLFEEKKALLTECVNGIDQRIFDCLAHVEEYKRMYSDLGALNEKLHELGADSIEMPESIPAEDLGGLIETRIQHLRLQGRL